VYSHVFEKNDHPDFVSESQYCQEQVTRFSGSLSTMDLSDSQPSPVAEAKQSDLETAEDAAISRFCPMQDGLDLWRIHMSRGVTELGGHAPG
jgi:hypothetical protein